MGDEEFTGAEEGAPGKKGGLPTIVIIVIIAVVMGAAGFFAGKILSGGGGDDNGGNAAQTGEATSGQGEKGTQTGSQTDTTDTASQPKNEETTAGTTAMGQQGILALDTFTVNLNDPFGRRYIEVVLNLMIDKKELIPKIKENELLMPKIRHEIFMTISAKSYNELKSTAGKIALFEEIQMRVNEILKQYMGVEPVVEVLQTKFLIQ